MDLPPTTPFVACGGADLTDQWEHGFDAPSYLRAMDAQGIDAVVLYPSVGLFVPYQPELTAAESADACRRYDDWVARVLRARRSPAGRRRHRAARRPGARGRGDATRAPRSGSSR